MIAEHQPTSMPAEISCGITDVSDGNMSYRVIGAPESDEEVLANRRRLFEKYDLSSPNLVYVTYQDDEGNVVDNYSRFGRADDYEPGQGIITPNSISPHDGLVTTEVGRTLFLPLADCVGGILFDPRKSVLMMVHSGRHGAEQFAMKKAVEYLVEHFESKPTDLRVWLSPAAGKENYPLYAFEDRSLQEVNAEHVRSAGVPMEHIEISPVDTTKDDRYYSHSEFAKGKRRQNGRVAIWATMNASV